MTEIDKVIKLYIDTDVLFFKWKSGILTGEGMLISLGINHNLLRNEIKDKDAIASLNRILKSKDTRVFDTTPFFNLKARCKKEKQRLEELEFAELEEEINDGVGHNEFINKY